MKNMFGMIEDRLIGAMLFFWLCLSSPASAAINITVVQPNPAQLVWDDRTDAIQNVSRRNGPFRFSVRTVSAKPVVVQASTDLVNWQTISSTAPNNGIVDFVDSNSARFGQRFYRTVLP